MADFSYKKIGIPLDLENWENVNDNFRKFTTDLTGIQKQMDILVVDGDSSPESAQARIGVDGEVYSSLKTRLDNENETITVQINENQMELTQQLVELNGKKADEVYVNSQVSALDSKVNSQTSGSPRGVYATLSALQTAKPTGDTGIYVVAGTGNWYYWNGTAWTSGGVYQSTGVPNKGVSFEKTTFLDVGKNKFDKTTRSVGMVVVETNGTLTSDLGTGYDTSDFIPVLAGVTYYINKVRKYALYDAAKNFISGLNNTAYGSATFTPSADGYVRFSTGTNFLNTAQLEIGTAPTAYESFKYVSGKMSASLLESGVVKDENVAPTSNIVLKKPGRNLLDISKVAVGYYVEYSTGNLVANADNKATDYIKLSPNTMYTLSNQSPQVSTKDIAQLAFYDATKMYVSGMVNSGTQSSITFTTGANVEYVRITILSVITSGMMLETGSTVNAYVPYKLAVSKADLPTITVDDLPEEALYQPPGQIVTKAVGKNLLDISNVTPGYYVDYSNGSLVANVDNKATDYIALKPNTTYTLSSQVNKDISQLAFYTSGKVYVSGLANLGSQESITFTTGATVYFMRVSIPTSVTTGVMLEKGPAMSSYEPYGFKIVASDLPEEALYQPGGVTIKVNQNGTGDFSSLRAAIASITDASALKPYTVEIYEGVYDIFGYYTVAELNNSTFDGLRIPDYVSIKGIGDKKKVILQGFLPDEDTEVTFASHGRISTLCPLGNGRIENLTATGKNLRYVVHDDYDYPNATLIVKNCDFIRYKGVGRNFGGKQAWGEGSWDGQTKIFEDVYFFTEWEDYFAYTTHNTAGNTKKSYHKFTNCKFFATSSANSIRFSSLDGQEETIELIGCKYNGGILVDPISPYTGSKYTLNGYGNDVVPVNFTNTDGIQHTCEFVGETREMFNGGAVNIAKGQPVMLNSSGTSVVPFTGNGKIRFFGIASTDIPTQSKGIVRVGGYLKINDTLLTGLAIGDAIGVVNGSLAKVTTADYIGSVVMTDFIKLT